MNQSLFSLDETVRYTQYPEMIGDLPGALHRAHEHIERLEQACEERESTLAKIEDRIDNVLAAFKDTFEALEEVLDDLENEGEIPAPLEALVRDDLKTDISALADLLPGLETRELETVEELAAEF